MDEPIKATYENGVFRPLTPPDLPDHAPVNVYRAPVEEAPAQSAPPSEPDDEVVVKQQAALRQVLEEVKQMSQHCNNDGWSAANNVDDLLYGGPDGPA